MVGKNTTIQRSGCSVGEKVEVKVDEDKLIPYTPKGAGF